jgi:hypothetical protein
MFLVSRKHKESNLESVPVIVIDADGNEHDGVYKETDEGELWVEVNGAYFFVLPRSKRFINGGKYVYQCHNTGGLKCANQRLKR